MSSIHQKTGTASQSVVENRLPVYEDQSLLSEEKDIEKEIYSLQTPSLKERLWENRAKLKEITAQYASWRLTPKLKSQFFSQIDWLLNSEHWNDDDHLANAESFKTLVKFILNSNTPEAPYLGLSDDGNLLASWTSGSNKLTLECLPENQTKWFVSCFFDGKRERCAGESPSLERLLAALQPYEKAGWFNKNGENKERP